MFISRCNRLFERHGRLAFLLIGVAIIIPFVLWVTPGGPAAATRGRNAHIGTMHGRRIDVETFQRHMQAADMTIFLNWGQFIGNNPRMFSFLMDETLKRMRALHEAKRQGLNKISDEDVLSTVRATPLFQGQNGFDREMFMLFQQNILTARGLDGQQFDEIIRENIMIKRLEDQAVAHVFVAPEEIRDEFVRNGEMFTIAHAEFRFFDLMREPLLQPSEEEMAAWFEANRADIRLPDRKRALVVEFDPAQHAANIEVSDAEMTLYFERNKERLYAPQGKSFEDVAGEIRERLQRSKAWQQSGERARELVTAVTEARSTTPETPAADLFRAAVAAAGLEAKESGFFTADGEIPGIGDYARLRAKAYELTAAAPFTDAVSDVGRYFVACLLEIEPGAAPESMTDAVRAQIGERLLREKARAFYIAHVEPFRADIDEGKTPDDLRNAFAEELRNTAELSDDERQEHFAAFNRRVSDYLAPYYVAEQRKARVATFSPATYLSQVSISHEDIEAAYRRDAATYEREEVRLRQIEAQFPVNATAEQKTAARQRIEGVLGQIREGADFVELARLHSDDAASKAAGGDIGFVARGVKSAALYAFAFAGAPGEISPIIETPTAWCLVRIEERRNGRALADVAESIRAELAKTEADRRAEEAAIRFSDRAFAAIEAGRGRSVAAEVYATVAAAEAVETKDTDWFRGQGTVPPFGHEPQLSEAAYGLSRLTVLSDVIKGRTDYFVACWLDSKPAYLPEFDDEPGLAERVQRHQLRNTALARIRERAQEAYVSIGNALVAGQTRDEAAGEITFEDVPGFTRQQPPAGVAEARKLLEALETAAPGTLLPVLETELGASLVFLVSRTPPAEETFADEKSRIEQQVRATKESAALQAFHKRLESESNTQISDEFRRRG